MAVALMACSVTASAQDLLVKTNGDLEKVKVLEVTTNEVKYKMYDNLEGPIFTVLQSQLVSIQFENGTVRKFAGIRRSNVADNSGADLTLDSNPAAKYFDIHGYDNALSFYLQNGWGIGWDIRKNFNEYIAWDIFGLSYVSGGGFHSPSDAGAINVRVAGVRGYTPSIDGFRGYVNLDMGYTGSYFSGYGDTVFSHGFGLDFGFGFQYKKFTLGYNLSYCTAGSSTSHWARIGIVF